MIFLYPNILWWLFLAIIPIIVHLFDFRKVKKVYFSNTKYLIDIEEKTHKEQKIRRIIIMILRILAIFFLVIAFARPILSSEIDKNWGETYTVSIVIDNSLSMMNSSQSKDPLQNAIKDAEDIIRQFPDNAQFQLLTCQASPMEQRLLSKEEALENLRKIRISAFSRQWDDWQTSIIKNNKKAGTINGPIFIFSDFQKYQYKMNPPFIVNLWAQEKESEMNLSVDSIWFDSPVQISNQKVSLSVKIKNYSQTPAEKIPVRLYIDDIQKGLSDVSIPAGGTEKVNFSFQLSQFNSHFGRVEIDDHPIVFDDFLYFSFNIRKQIPIVRIRGEGSGTAVNTLFERDSLFNYKNLNENVVSFDQLEDFPFVILDENTTLSAGLSSQIINFLKQGGSVLYIPAAQNGDRSDFLSTVGIGSLGKLDTANTRLLRLNYRHSFFSGVFEAIPENISLPTIDEHYVIPNSGGEKLLELQNGRSFLQMYRIEKGNLYILASSLSKNSRFAKHPLFVPTIMQMAFLSNNAYKMAASLSEKEGIEIPLSSKNESENFILKNLNGSFSMRPLISNGNPRRMFLQQMIQEPGVYRLHIGDEKQELLIALNYDRSESDARFFSRQELDSISEKNKNVKILNNISDIKTRILEKSSLFPLWKISLLFVLLFLLAEVILLRIWGKNLA